ncbi:MAG TPA: DUF2510 domain-containing protein [Ilumatobacteraceae bacterium]|nr:DUF2510 domain-containing protein [Ilumatobacteraceae bacterium]
MNETSVSPTGPPLMPPPDWYPDPEQPWSWRWWDGQRWTDMRAPMLAERPGRDPYSVSAWFDDSVAAVKAVVVRVGLLVLVVVGSTTVLFGVFAMAVFTSGRGREIRSLLRFDDLFGGSATTVELTDAEWDRVRDLAGDIAVSSVPWLIALSVIAAITGAWALAVCARVADRVPSATVGDVTRLDDSADALRRVPVVIAAFVVLSAIGLGVLAVAFLPLVAALAVGAGGAAVAVAAVFGAIAAVVVLGLLLGRLALAVVLAAVGGWGLGLRRSWELTDGHYWATVGRLAVAALVAGAASAPFSLFNSFGLSFGFVTWLVVLVVAQTVSNVVNTVVSTPAQVVLVHHLTARAGTITQR